MRPIYFLLLVLIIIPYAYSLDCQYTKFDDYIGEIEVLVDENSTIIENTTLEFLDFTNGTEATFTIHNPLSYSVEVFLKYSVIGYKTSVEKFSVEIAPNSSRVVRVYCYNEGVLGNCSIDGANLYYHIMKPIYMIPVKTRLQMKREVCDGLDDGQPCSKDDVCGSRICNIAGYCGNEKIVECLKWLEGTKNCNNQTCLKSSTKNVGETYSCIWQCKSNYGKDGICKDDPLTILKGMLLFFSLIILIIAVAWYFFLRGLNEKEQKSIAMDIAKLEGLIRQAKKVDREIGKIEQLEEQLKAAKEKLRKEKLKPYKNKLGHLVHINEDGYEVFHLSGHPVHSWVAKKFIYYKNRHKYPLPWREYHVHHKDGNKLNNEIDNLKILTKEEHIGEHSKF